MMQGIEKEVEDVKLSDNVNTIVNNISYATRYILCTLIRYILF